MMSRTGTFKKEREVLRKFMKERKIYLSEEVKTIMNVLHKLLTYHSPAVKNFDLKDASLHGFMAAEAEKFYKRLKEKNSSGAVLFERDGYYLYDYASISLVYGSITLLYPLMLVKAANYRNFIPLLCKKLLDTGNHLALEDFLAAYLELINRCKPVITTRDIELLKELTKFDFSVKNYYQQIMTYQSKKTFTRLAGLGVAGLYYTVNFPALGLLPYLHLSSRRVKILGELTGFIEYEYHEGKKKRDYQVFRVFLLPEKRERELVPVLKESGNAGEMKEWYVRYNWDLFIKEKKYGPWKWKLDLEDLEPLRAIDTSRFDHVRTMQSLPVTGKFITFLEAVHRSRSLHTASLSATTGISEHMVKKYRKEAIEGQFILPYCTVAHTGADSFYQLCLENKPLNERLISFLETLPKISVMKSEEFSRYLLYLPRNAISRVKSLLQQEEDRGECEILWKNEILVNSKTIISGVQLDKLLEKNDKIALVRK
ncbi:MAG: hypothetical protein ACFFD4_38410 [Candidatus Odinarchaeota archaeon]